MTDAPETGYQVLARKYRPATFVDLIGQEAMVRTLRNAFAADRIAQAFVLTGIRGTGKTTTARIIAKGLNCIGPDGTGGPTTDPCGQCEHCLAIMEGRHVDVMEMDAASNTGVQNIRDAIIDSVSYRAASARYKVFIIDEAHMLTKEAFNALLKTLEEPPRNATFILATTEPQKFPATIVSRCQRLAIPTPKRDIAVAWLRAQGGEADWDLLLDVAGGAPLQALALHREDFAAQATRLADDIRQLESGHASPVTVAQRWGGHDAPLLTQWLYRLLAGAIRARAAAAPATARDAPLQTGGKPLTMQALQQRLADVEELRRMGSKAIRMDIQYAALLQRWYA